MSKLGKAIVLLFRFTNSVIFLEFKKSIFMYIWEFLKNVVIFFGKYLDFEAYGLASVISIGVSHRHSFNITSSTLEFKKIVSTCSLTIYSSSLRTRVSIGTCWIILWSNMEILSLRYNPEERYLAFNHKI